MINPQKIEIVRKYKDQLTDLGIPVTKIIIFGSQVKGTPNKWSDLDVCVISPVFGVNRLSERVLLTKISRDISDEIEPHPMSPADLNDKFSPLSNEIRAYGVEV
ncbi:MAG: hypothetical protein UX06_C0042G0003 [Candidatus Giovannonibacteria bacterium GW2011_GWA2_45_21]|uniref:Polymerase nucleotidyl transferase domain-containing protein n=1 Tax=Candidatus Giovannonibacteria bacterium GW2011_GWA2_45_21 TaxID=1618649 RepID=A0A0G1M5H5_9BACT|nr:MAG: hypothetical protein UX06_C0042G0003 [Candidatus Giovannonibacteria bacterium GW2011_GWA2_45_21]